MSFLVRWLETSWGDLKESGQLQEQLGVLVQRMRQVRGPYSSHLYKLRSAMQQAAGKNKDVGELPHRGGQYEHRKQTPHHEHLYELVGLVLVPPPPPPPVLTL